MDNTESFIDKEIANMVFAGNEEMYKKYLYQMVERDFYGQVMDFVKSGDLQKAFETAHTWKGLVQNLALPGISKSIENLVEVLRAGNTPSHEMLDALTQKYTALKEYIDNIRANNISVLS